MVFWSFCVWKEKRCKGGRSHSERVSGHNVTDNRRDQTDASPYVTREIIFARITIFDFLLSPMRVKYQRNATLSTFTIIQKDMLD